MHYLGFAGLYPSSFVDATSSSVYPFCPFLKWLISFTSYAIYIPPSTNPMSELVQPKSALAVSSYNITAETEITCFLKGIEQ